MEDLDCLFLFPSAKILLSNPMEGMLEQQVPHEGKGLELNIKNEQTPSRLLDPGPFYHGTKAELKQGDLLEPGHGSNYSERKKANYVYLTATLDAAIWGAELAVGDEPGRIYRVEPTGIIEDDPNLTDKKFPGNPTRSYRTQHSMRVVGEVLDWGALPRRSSENAGSP